MQQVQVGFCSKIENAIVRWGSIQGLNTDDQTVIWPKIIHLLRARYSFGQHSSLNQTEQDT